MSTAAPQRPPVLDGDTDEHVPRTSEELRASAQHWEAVAHSPHPEDEIGRGCG